MAVPSVWEMLAQKYEKPTPKWSTPGEMAQAFDPATKQTPLMDLFDAELIRAWEGKDARLLLTCPPQMGKASGCRAASLPGS